MYTRSASKLKFLVIMEIIPITLQVMCSVARSRAHFADRLILARTMPATRLQNGYGAEDYGEKNFQAEIVLKHMEV